jgi:hypothetical protein
MPFHLGARPAIAGPATVSGKQGDPPAKITASNFIRLF